MSFNVEQLVNRQVLKWQEEARVAARGPLGPVPETQRPMICISREYGGRGAEIGRLVAQSLGFHYYSQELVEQIAQLAHVRRQVVESVDERLLQRVEAWIGEQIGGGFFSPSDYLRNLSKVVLTLGRHGKGVVIGRGAQFILDPAYTLRVRAVAPLEVRIARIASVEKVDEGEARARVRRVDAERAAFCRQHFDQDVSEARHYDLVVNTGTLPVPACAELVVAAFRARFPDAS